MAQVNVDKSNFFLSFGKQLYGQNLSISLSQQTHKTSQTLNTTCFL